MQAGRTYSSTLRDLAHRPAYALNLLNNAQAGRLKEAAPSLVANKHQVGWAVVVKQSSLLWSPRCGAGPMAAMGDLSFDAADGTG
jgi:hypothetical protein